MTPIKKPMLAPSEMPTRETLEISPQHPILASRKLDGIRALWIPDHGFISRNGKPLPSNNALTVRFFRDTKPSCILDGELWSPDAKFNEITSGVMSNASVDDLDVLSLRYYVFDNLLPYEWSLEVYPEFVKRLCRFSFESNDLVIRMVQTLCGDWNAVESLLVKELEGGGEGLILRSINGTYKHGRCTFRERNMLKLKSFDTLDVRVVDFEPLSRMNDDIDRSLDELGRPRKVHKQDQRHSVEMLGALVVADRQGRQFKVGSGFTDFDRVTIWAMREQYRHKWLSVKYMKCGELNKPRFPVFVRWRPDLEGVV